MKKIIFFLVYLTVNSFSDDVGECCTQYGFENSGASSTVEKRVIGTGHWTNTETDEFISNQSGYNKNRVCESAGVVLTKQLDYDNLSDFDSDYKADRSVFTLVLHYPCVCNESTPPPPPAEEDPLLWDKIYQGDASSAPSECYEPDGINFKSYSYKTVACGDVTMRCYKKQ